MAPLSIRHRLAASATALVLIVAAVLAVAAYREVRRSAVVVTRQHVENVARQLSDMFATSARQALDQAKATAGDSSIARFLHDRSPAASAAAGARLAGRATAGGSRRASELWDRDGQRLLTTRDTVPVIDQADARALIALAANSGGPAIGWIGGTAGHLGYAVIAPVTTGNAIDGFVVERHRLGTSPQSSNQLRDLIGTGTSLLVGNSRGDLWTNFVDIAPPPPIRDAAVTAAVEYERPRGHPVIAAVAPLRLTPWTLVVETPMALALAPAHALLRRLAMFTLLLVVLAATGAWVISGTLTRPIAGLVTAAERMSAGDLTERVQVGRLDELGVLGTSFNAMAERIASSRSALERKVVEVQDAESRYHMLFDASPQPMWVFDIETGEFLAVNDAAVRRYGYSRAEFLGMTIPDIRPPEEIPAVRETVARLRTDPDAQSDIWRHRAKDGSLIEVESSTRELTFADRRARLVLVHDLTERRRAEEASRAAQERLERVIASSSAILYELRLEDSGTVLEWMSHNVTTLLGYDLAEVQSSNWWSEKVHPDDRERLGGRPDAKGYRDGANEFRFRHKNGDYRWLREEQRLVPGDTRQSMKVVGAWLDITEQRQLEDHLRQAQKMEAVGRLAGGIAHDFNNLLTVIAGFTGLLLDGRADDHADREPLVEIQKAAARAADLTRQLLAFSRQQVLRPHNIDLNAVIDNANKMLRRLAGEDTQMSTLLDPTLGLVYADPGQVEQVLMNLVVNARDAMPEGGALTIETRRTVLDENFAGLDAHDTPGRYAAIIVSDTGTGMTPEIRERIFDPFYTTKEPGKGTGLGLATVHGIVEQSGGRVFVYSEPGRGTTFKIYFPIVGTSVVDPEVPSTEATTTTGAESVLLVEDDAAVRKVTASILSKAGYSVIEAVDGADGLRICEDPAIAIDVVITDMVMPVMDGSALARGVQTCRPGMPIIFVSGYSRSSISPETLTANARFVEKPFSADALLRTLRELLDSPRAA